MVTIIHHFLDVSNYNLLFLAIQNIIKYNFSMWNKIIFYTLSIIFFPFLVAWFGNWRHMMNSGNEAYWKQNYDVATDAFHQVTLDKPNYSTAFYNLGTALYKNGRYQQAASAFRNAILNSNVPNEAAVYYNLGNVQFQLRDLKAAIESYKHSLRLNPNDVDAKHNLALALELLNSQEQNITQNMEGTQKQETENGRPQQLSNTETQQLLEQLGNKESIKREKILKQKLNTGYRREKDW